MKRHRKIAARRRLVVESLEPRVMLDGDVWAMDPFYLPPEHRLGNTGGLLTGGTSGEPFQIAAKYLSDHAAELGLNRHDLENYVVSSQYTDSPSGVTHIYLRQMHDGLEVINADLSINITASGEVINVTSTFLRDPRAVTSTILEPSIDAPEALSKLSDVIGLQLNSLPRVVGRDARSPSLSSVIEVDGEVMHDIPAELVYVPTPHGLQRAWQLNVQTNDREHWYNAFVSADSGQTLYVDDWIQHMSYRVFDSPLVSPNEGGRTLVSNPADSTASPFGWHDTDGAAGAEYTDTRGNNASVQEDIDHNNLGGARPSGGPGLDFDFLLDTSQNPVNYQSAAEANMFYWINRLHDIHYQYGFTEAAGNFQVNNYGRGGVAGDPVLGDIQDGDGGGPSFITPPDGQSPRMQMYLNTTVAPARDSALDNTVLIHEYGHGISERLTGGPANTSALNALQSTGLSEGWSDWWALMLTQDSADMKLSAYPVGNWYYGHGLNGPGARRYPYSFDMATDPLTLGDYNNASTRSSRHKMGEIWCAALWDMNWLLIDKHGFSSDLYRGNGGNNLALQLVMDGLKLQGTNPSYLDARDAILTADIVRTGGQNQTEIWTAFARRGMGYSASDGGSASATSVTEAFDIPGTVNGVVFRDDDADGVQNAGEPGLAGWTVYRDQNNNGSQDVANTTTFSSIEVPKTITDPGTIFSNLVISGASGQIVDVDITVSVSHPNVADLNLALIPPSGTPVILAQFLGGTGDNYTNTVFDDEAQTYVTSATAPFTGAFKPFYSLSQLDGLSPNGTWKLRLDDVASGSSGSLVNWSMQMSYGNPDPAAVTDANGNYMFMGVGNGVHHIREAVPSGFIQTAPAGGVYSFAISNGQVISGKNFGNRSAATISVSSTIEDTISSSMAINPPAGLGATHFKISNILGGMLLENDGVTLIHDGDFITVAKGHAGVRFLPSANSNTAGSFDVELSQNGSSVTVGTSKVKSLVSVIPVGDTPSVANSTTSEGTLSDPIVIRRNQSDGAEVTHFKVSGITGGTLYKNDGTTMISNGAFITFTEGLAGLRFLPAVGNTTEGRFDVESSEDGLTVAAQSGKATSIITISPLGNAPPKVTAIFVRGGGWNSNYLNMLAANNLGSAAGGYRLRDGSTQIANSSLVTWATIDQISVTFSEDVTVASNSLRMLNSANQDLTLATNGFSYNGSTQTAKWTLAAPLSRNKFLIALDADTILDSNGAALDGEWTTSVSTYATSGNGEPGGDLYFRFNYLPGDVTQNGQTNTSDVGVVRGVGTAIPDSSNFRYDVTGNNLINTSDVGVIRGWGTLTLAGLAEPTIPPPTNGSPLLSQGTGGKSASPVVGERELAPLVSRAKPIGLLTVALHELGHPLGLDEGNHDAPGGSLLKAELAAGTRHLPRTPPQDQDEVAGYRPVDQAILELASDLASSARLTAGKVASPPFWPRMVDDFFLAPVPFIDQLPQPALPVRVGQTRRRVEGDTFPMPAQRIDDDEKPGFGQPPRADAVRHDDANSLVRAKCGVAALPEEERPDVDLLLVALRFG